ncbi:MAG: hypothetical protein ABSA71_19450 [Desulfomonilia bacterium]|jgi:hypothetical protein
MLTLDIFLTVAAIIIYVLIYFAGVQRGKQLMKKDIQRHEIEREEERIKRIHGVVSRYRDLVNSVTTSDMNGMLRAGVLGLNSSEEVAEACSIIEAQGLTPGIQKIYMDELQGADLLLFFRLLQKRPLYELCDDGCVRRIIREVKEKRIA